MKKVLLIPVLFMTLPLSGCFEANFDEYKTPDLFLSHITEVHSYNRIHSSKVDCPNGYMDYDFTVKNEILKIDDFESVSSFKPSSDRYITYASLHSHSTAGPNYSDMYIYDNGQTIIECKKALSKVKRFYLTCSSDKAEALNTFVESWLNGLIEDERRAVELGNEGATIENFFIYMESQSSAHVYCADQHFEDHGELLSVMKGVNYVKIDDEYPPFAGQRLLYYKESPYDYEGDSPAWNFTLSDDYKMVKIVYDYKYKGIRYSKTVYYSISATDGHAIEDKAIELLLNN